jgi:alpha-tubulin suppressor-like RCC1 family protein
VAACLGEGTGQGTCGYACTGGKLKCPSGCCDAVAIAAGDEHTCAITTDGSLSCWGLDNWGQVTGADANAVVELPPVTVPVQRYASGVTAVAAGHYHTCAVVNDAVECWGWNDEHQTEPPAGLTGVTALAAGFYHTCAIAAGGTVRCWGGTGLYETGGGTPIAANATRISAGWNHTCALVGDAVKCWGSNAVAQLGNGTQGGSSAMPATPIASGIGFLGAGRNHTCAASGDDRQPFYCWGAEPGPAFGLGNPQATPAIPTKDGTDPTFDRAVAAIAAGRTHTCVIRAGNTGAPNEGIECFGPENVAGQLGGTPTAARETADVANSVGAKGIAAGADHTCAIFADGGVSCWGMNGSGQLGNGTLAFPGIGQVVQVSGR